MKPIRSRSFRQSLTVLMGLLAALLSSSPAGAASPQWKHPWQNTLAKHLETLQASDYAASAQTIKPDWFEANQDKIERYRYLVGGYTPLLPFVGQLANLPAESFTWGQIWKGDEPITQAFLKSDHLNIKQGQLWIPAHPSAACLLAWAYHTREPWNPYAGDKAIANRAAAIAMIALIGWAESDYYHRDPSSSYTGRRFGVHGGVAGFSLTFQAYTLFRLKDALPPDVFNAWSQGVKFMCERINTNTPTGPANMRLSVPVGMYYAYLATGDQDILALYKRWMGLVVYSNLLSPAGHYYDGEGRGPDGSYNGIGTHRLAELHSITHDPDLLKVLRQFYALKAYQTLPEPDGSWLSPSHYNDRCQSSFANDQYGGRETQLVADVPWATLYLRRQREKQKPLTPTQLATLASRPASRLPGAFPFDQGQGRSGRMHDWGNILHLPDFEYHVDEATVATLLADNSIQLPVLTSDRFANNFHNEFIHVRRPAYYALFYAGATSASDNGVTNYRGMLKDQGGLFNGLAGGGLSALWTPAGTFLLGRLTAYEDYERKELTLGEKNSKYLIPGWQDWANNHIIGQTAEGKIVGSARVSWPTVTFPDPGQSLTIAGAFPKKSGRQGEMLEADIRYQRDYRFDDDALSARLTLTSDKPVALQSLYEVIPVQITPDLQTVFLDAQDKPLPEAERIAGVKTIRLQREHGALAIVFDAPQVISRQSVQIVSRQANTIRCRTLLVELPATLPAQTPVTLGYRLVPQITGEIPPATRLVGGTLPPLPPALEPVIQDKLHELNVDRILAHYRMDGVEAAADGKVARWRDASPHGLHLTPPSADQSPTLAPDKSAVIFSGKRQGLGAAIPASVTATGLSGVALIDCDHAIRATRPAGHARVISIVHNQGAKGEFSIIPYAPSSPEAGPYTISNSRYFREESDKPVSLGMGAQYTPGEGAPKIGGPMYPGRIIEVILYDTNLTAWQLQTLKRRLERLHGQAGQ